MGQDSTPQDEIERFEEQYRSQPESLVFARLADAYRKAGRPEQAQEVLVDGLARHPDYPSGHIVYARTLRDLGRLDEAALSFRRVLELDAENLVAVAELGSLAEERHELAEARHWYERLVHVDPTNDEAAQRLAELERSLGSYPEDDVPETPAPEPLVGESPEDPDGMSEWWNDPLEVLPQEPHEDAVLPTEEVAEPSGIVTPADDESLPGDEIVAAILNGDVSRTVRAEDTWWYEERPAHERAEPSPEADLLTQTMADLYAEQGLFDEAAEIYEELLRDSPDNIELQERLTRVREKLASRAHSPHGLEPADEAPVPGRSPDTPVVEEIQRILRQGEERASALPEPEYADLAVSDPETVREDDETWSDDTGADPGAADQGTHETESGGLSTFARDWIAGLENSD